jgi:hypothetical protein
MKKEISRNSSTFSRKGGLGNFGNCHVPINW